MHSEPMPESAGEFTDEWTPSKRSCPACGKTGAVFVRTWESGDGAYVDLKFECRECGKVWWIDGDDG